MSLRLSFIISKTEKLKTALAPSLAYFKVSMKKKKYVYKTHWESYKIKCTYKLLSSPLPYCFLVIITYADLVQGDVCMCIV